MNLGAALPALLPLAVFAIAGVLGLGSQLRAGDRVGRRGRLAATVLGAAALAALTYALELVLRGRLTEQTWAFVAVAVVLAFAAAELVSFRPRLPLSAAPPLAASLSTISTLSTLSTGASLSATPTAPLPTSPLRGGGSETARAASTPPLPPRGRGVGGDGPASRDDLLEALDDGVLVLDPAGYVAEANSAAARLLGVPDIAALVGEHFARLLPAAPPDVRDVAAPPPDAPRLDRPWHPAPLDDGRTVALQVHPLAEVAGASRQIVVLRNVTAQTRVVESLVDERETLRRRLEAIETANLKLLQRNIELTRKHEEADAIARGLEAKLHETSLAVERTRDSAELESLRLQVVVDQLPDGLIIVETERELWGDTRADVKIDPRIDALIGAIIDSDPANAPRLAVVNAAARRFWPTALDTGRPLRPDTPTTWPAVAEPLAAAIDDAVRARRRVPEVRATVVGGDGVERSLVLSVVPLLRGSRPAAVAVLRDATGLAAELSSRAEYVAFASHELRSPLTVIRGYVQALLHDIAGGGTPRAEAERNLRSIERQTSRMLSLVNDLLDVSRMEAGRFAISPEPTLVATFLERVCGEMQLTAQTHRVTFAIAPGLEYAVALWDQDRIEQVVANLVQNAAKFGPAGTVIAIGVAREGEGAVRVSVRDEGDGVAPEHRERVFDRYYQAPGARTSAGLGLGLYISREIVLAHGGRIWVDSTPERGATFAFALPVEGDSAEE